MISSNGYAVGFQQSTQTPLSPTTTTLSMDILEHHTDSSLSRAPSQEEDGTSSTEAHSSRPLCCSQRPYVCCCFSTGSIEPAAWGKPAVAYLTAGVAESWRGPPRWPWPEHTCTKDYKYWHPAWTQQPGGQEHPFPFCSCLMH